MKGGLEDHRSLEGLIPQRTMEFWYDEGRAGKINKK